MNDPFDWKELAIYLGGVVMTIIGFITKRLHDRVDKHESSHVTRDELAQTLAQMREDRRQMHDENRQELRYIRDRVDGIADRQ